MHRNPSSVKRRPVTVTILALAVLIIAVINLARFWAALRNWNTLVSLGVRPAPLFIVLTGLFWAITGLALFRLIWIGHSRARLSSFIIIALYIMYFWMDRLVFQNPISQENTPFALGMTILVVFYTVLSLSLPANQAFLSRKNEQ
jgi:hypothetical protein